VIEFNDIWSELIWGSFNKKLVKLNFGFLEIQNMNKPSIRVELFLVNVKDFFSLASFLASLLRLDSLSL
jgi:hypothetical protein